MASVGVIVAQLDLKLVQLLRGAMNGSPVSNCHKLLPRKRIDPEPRIEPRKVFHPTPRIEPRPIIRPEPRVIEQPSPVPLEPERPVRLQSHIQAPWKMLAWESPIQPSPKIKVSVHRPDVVTKGSLIDFFI